MTEQEMYTNYRESDIQRTRGNLERTIFHLLYLINEQSTDSKLYFKCVLHDCRRVSSSPLIHKVILDEVSIDKDGKLTVQSTHLMTREYGHWDAGTSLMNFDEFTTEGLACLAGDLAGYLHSLSDQRIK